jgi:serine/threonine protein kinase
MDLKGKTINDCYNIVEKVGENSICDVYKAVGVLSPLEFALKIFKKPNSEYKEEDIIRFKKDMFSIYRIYHPNITKVFEIDNLENYTYVTMEFTYGMSLKHYLDKGEKLNYEDILLIIMDIANGLEVAHRNGSLHKNLNLLNIILCIENKKIKSAKITNFGFGEIFLSYADKESLSDLLPYLPPENCSICNRKFDKSSDLFSLGVIMYYLLTDKFPFYGNSVESYFKSLANTKPDLPSKISKYEIPPVLDKIIFKLLSLNKNERYQSALGLLTDLERIKRNEFIFDLGVEDNSFSNIFQTDLIDRDEEISLLSSIYENAKKSKGIGMIISGEYGIGKARVAETLSENVIKDKGVYLKVNCMNKNLPYNVFKSLIRNYFYYLEILDDKKQKEILNKIKSFDELSGNILSFFIKSCDLNISKYEINNEKIKDVSKDFADKISDLICAFSSIELPMIIVIGNIELADQESLMVILELLKKIENYPLVLILTCSSNIEITDDFLLKIINSDIKKIELNPLAVEDSKKLLSDILKDKDNTVTNIIIDKIHKIAKGNPYYMIEFLRQLINEGIIYPDIDRWDIDLKKFDLIKIETTKDIILKKLQLLRSNEFNILTYADLVDSEFDLDFLFKLLDNDKEEIIAVADDLINEDFLKLQNYYHNNYIFSNIITKEILSSRLDVGKRKFIHELIANKIEETIECEPYNIFLAVNHYMKSENFNKMAECALKATVTARKINAINTIKKILSQIITFFEKANKTECKDYVELKKALYGIDLLAND